MTLLKAAFWPGSAPDASFGDLWENLPQDRKVDLLIDQVDILIYHAIQIRASALSQSRLELIQGL